MVSTMKRNKQERLQIVLDICKKLKNFPKSTYMQSDPHPFLDLYNSEYPAMQQLKNVFSKFVNQDDHQPDLLCGFSGKIKIPQLNKSVQYVLPIKCNVEATCVVRSN
ncbi:hypothetical protein EB077_05790 [bacterium]|nr:hypothetical protein [bacterium]